MKNNIQKEKWEKYLELLRESDNYKDFFIIDEELKRNTKFIEEAVKIHPEIYIELDKELKTESVTLATLSVDADKYACELEEIFYHVPKEQLANQEILLKCIAKDIFLDDRKYYDEELQKYKGNKEFFSKVLDEAYSWNIQHVYLETEIDIENDKETMMKMINKFNEDDEISFEWGEIAFFEDIFEKLDSKDKIRNEKEIFKELSKKMQISFSMFGEELCKDVDFIIELIRSGADIDIPTSIISNNKELALAFLTEDIIKPDFIEKACPNLLEDIIIKEAVETKKQEINEKKTEEKIFKALLRTDKKELQEGKDLPGKFYQALLMKKMQEAPKMDIDEYIRRNLAQLIVHKLIESSITNPETLAKRTKEYHETYPELADYIADVCEYFLLDSEEETITQKEDTSSKTYTLK